MCSLVSYKNNNLPDYCSICQEKINNGCINKNKFVINPIKWNFEILYCGHVFCCRCFNNPNFPNNCPLCRKFTMIEEFSFNSIPGPFLDGLTNTQKLLDNYLENISFNHS